MRFLFSILIIFLTALNFSYAEECSWLPKVKFTADLYQVIELENATLLNNQAPLISDYVSKYQEHYRQKIEVSQLKLRERQLAIFKKHFKEDEPSVQMMKLIIENKIGKTRPSNCFEMLLHEYHLKRVGVRDGTEFGAHVLLHPHHGIRILYQSSDDATVPVGPHLNAHLDEAISEGYELVLHIHIHPFILENGDYGGVSWPSGPGLDFGDLSVYVNLHKKYGLKEARVTNGFDTFSMNPAEYTHLKNLKPAQK